jgi:DNA-binding CsgD family transcriptional regulator
MEDSMATPPERSGGHLPPWIELLGMPVWVTGNNSTVVYMNSRAETLFNCDARDCIGQPCHKVIGGRKPSGTRFCQPNCTVRRLAEQGREIEPFPLTLPGPGKRKEQVRVVVIAADSPAHIGRGPHVYVHCVVDDARHERVKRYLDKVVARSPHAGAEDTSLEEFQLTSREREILRLLAEDETLHGIAHRLDLSYATIRNHVQHILRKLGVHSILEAVAFYLLIEG